MSYIQYAVESPSGTIRRSGAENGSLACKYGGVTKQTISSVTTVTKATGGKIMSADLQFGSSANIACANKMMPADVVIRTAITSGQKYHVITSSGSWTVPPNVNHIYVFAVGGGAGGNTRYYSYTSTNEWRYQYGGGGAGGYVNKKHFNVTPGEQFTCVIGAGGAGAGAPTSEKNKLFPAGAGGETSFSNANHTVKASGGLLYDSPSGSSVARHSGNGGSAGGAGGWQDKYGSNTSYKAGQDGFPDGTDDGGATLGSYGEGQRSTSGPNGESGSTTCPVDNVAYSGGGGGGAHYNREYSTANRRPGIGASYGGGNGGGAYTYAQQTHSTAGLPNSGGGGGGGGGNFNNADIECATGQNGGSGVIIVYWE